MSAFTAGAMPARPPGLVAAATLPAAAATDAGSGDAMALVAAAVNACKYFFYTVNACESRFESVFPTLPAVQHHIVLFIESVDTNVCVCGCSMHNATKLE